MKKLFKRDLTSLNSVFEFIADFTTQYHLDKITANSLSIAVEEIFTNLIKYNRKSKADIGIDISLNENVLLITFTDFNGQPFDITKVEAYDIRQPLEKRPIGKVGMHLVKVLMDDIHCEFNDKHSKIILMKKLKESHV